MPSLFENSNEKTKYEHVEGRQALDVRIVFPNTDEARMKL